MIMINAQIIKSPVITEKSLNFIKTRNTYVFEVNRSATKNQIKQEIERLFFVNVIDVNTIMRSRVMKATGRKRLKVVIAKTKKALVTLKDGETIKLFDVGERS